MVLLLVSLLAAALLAGLMEKNAQLESAAEDAQPGTEDLAGLLEFWTSDPQALETPDRDAYRDLVDQLEDQGRLDDWKDMLSQRLGNDHTLVVALEPGDEPNREPEPEAGPVEIRWADDTAADELDDDDRDPDIRWVD